MHSEAKENGQVNGNGPANGVNGQNGHSGKTTHVLVVGAGLAGLLIAQGLRKLNATLEAEGHSARYSWTIYERDESQLVRGGGFSLTIHWALEQLCQILPEEMHERVYKCVGNPVAFANGDMGTFTYLNMRTGEPLIHAPIPAGWKGARMARIKFIDLLMEGVDVHFSKRITGISFPDSGTVCAEFEDGEKAIGDLLIGADGSRSLVRRFQYGEDNAKNRKLPIRMINCRAAYPMSSEMMQKSLAIDPHLFHGGDPEQNGYFMFAFLDVPPPDKPDGLASVQLTISWPFEEGYLGEKEGSDPPETFDEQREWLKRIAKHWASPVRDLIYNIADDSVLRNVNIEEWLPSDDIPRFSDKRVTVVGDAAHLMTSCKSNLLIMSQRLCANCEPVRGENANHGVVDVAGLLGLLRKSGSGEIDIEDVVGLYEEEMISRTRPATVKARMACLDANHYAQVKPGSMFLAKRSMRD